MLLVKKLIISNNAQKEFSIKRGNLSGNKKEEHDDWIIYSDSDECRI